MRRDVLDDHPLNRLPGLFEITIIASDAAFLAQALAATFRYPTMEAQREVLARVANLAAERTSQVHRHLDEALRSGERKAGENANTLKRES